MSGCSSVWGERSVWVREVGGSNPLIPTIYFASVAELGDAPDLGSGSH